MSVTTHERDAFQLAAEDPATLIVRCGRADFLDCFAVSLLTVMAIASVIGTVLKQIEPSAIGLYGGTLDAANSKFFLKYGLSSQSAILWMSTLFFLATLFYWGGLIVRPDFGGRSAASCHGRQSVSSSGTPSVAVLPNSSRWWARCKAGG